MMKLIDAILQYPAAWLCWMLPFIGAFLIPLTAKINRKLRDYVAVVFSFLAAIATASMIPDLISGHWPGDIKMLTWITFPGRAPLEIGVLVDPLSIIMANVVAFISFLIIVYSLGYMHGDACLTRYWFFFNFFIGSMLLLVLSNNFIQLLIGWEGVGMCSYMLIGFYYRDEKEHWLGGPPPTRMFPPSHCGMKAFVVTGVGDVLLLAATFIIYHYAGTFNFVDLIKTAPTWLGKFTGVPGLLSMTAILLLGGPIGKSAQFPLHEWLPEAMAGPTPASALIHAATMVKAGVYLVARVSPIFYTGYWVFGIGEAMTFFVVVAVDGAFTAFLSASQAMVAVELKKVLAYSTISQIGYMMLSLGVSGMSAGTYVAGVTASVFHLVSHALFKAALFLCAGSVIHVIESIYMFNMGGLRGRMPLTHAFMLTAALSLSGVPPLSGFWSKDAIFVACLQAGTPLTIMLFAVAAISAAMTIFYSIRLVSLTFYGKPSRFIKEREREGQRVHEVNPVMWAPCAILVTLVICVGVLGAVGLAAPQLSPDLFIEEKLYDMLHRMGVPLHSVPIEEVSELMATGASATALFFGGVIGYVFYLARKINSWQFVSGSPFLKGIHAFLWKRWYINPTYYAVFVGGLLRLNEVIFKGLEKGVIGRISGAISGLFIRLGRTMFKTIETIGIDRGLNVGVPTVATDLYHRIKKIQTGVLSYNIIYIIIALLILIFGFTLWSTLGGI